MKPIHILAASLAALLSVLVATPLLADGDPAAAGPPKNLQVLPKEMPRKDVVALMKTFNKALGVKCGFCHNTKDFSEDGNKHKELSRKMMRMTVDIHGKYFAEEKDFNLTYNCWMCHRGAEEPQLQAP